MLSLIFILGLNLSAFSFALENLPKKSTADNIDDPPNDVIAYNSTAETCNSTSLFAELDIDTMTRSGQQFIVTLFLPFRLNMGYDYILSIVDEGKTYVVYGTTEDLVLAKPDMSYWNGTEFTTTGVPVIIGSISVNVMTADVPIDVVNITDSTTWTFAASYNDEENSGYIYLDFCPDESSSVVCREEDNGNGDGNGDDDVDDDVDDEDKYRLDVTFWDLVNSIPGYEMPLLILIVIVVSVGLIYKFRKKYKI